MTRVPNMEVEPIDLRGALSPRRLNGVEENAVTVSGPYRGITREAAEPRRKPAPETQPAEIERRVKEVMDREPESDEAVVRSNVTDGVKKLRRQKALEAEGSAREEAPDYDTGSQEVRRGRRKR